ncbi:hypothetical protein AZH53_00405 [Methanomicrobiaceae archaeon CYW5]|uniref:DUF504 domain-containing protein n=1 Tax=Methanovulcanius yangii TaxID=1789227 RepID=UPI0029CA602A|nr:DUF504 domain-containing protein [Methanovulcanius yangii]MBT8506890.1 hypothetical protein [Methanovulcanius yangii]
MRTSHALLLRMWHDAAFDFGQVTVEYVNRGAPGDRSSVAGGIIAGLDRDYFTVASGTGEDTPIPYHRILRILYKGIPVWERPA